METDRVLSMAEWRVALAKDDTDKARKIVWIAREIFDRFACYAHPIGVQAMQQILMDLEQAGSEWRREPIDFERMSVLLGHLRERAKQELVWARESGLDVPDFTNVPNYAG